MKRLLVMVMLVLLCTVCFSCNTKPPVNTNATNMSSEAVSCEPVNTTESTVSITLETTNMFESAPAEIDDHFLTKNYDSENVVLWFAPIGLMSYNLFYTEKNSENIHKVIIDVSVINKDFLPGPFGFKDLYPFNLFDVCINLPSEWEYTERVEGSGYTCFAEVTENNIFECFISQWIYPYKLEGRNKNTIDVILDEGVFSWPEGEWPARGISKSDQDYKTGILDNGHDYLLLTQERTEFGIVQYDCYVQLNDEYLYSFTLILKEADVDFVYDVMESVVIAESD